MRSKGSPGVPDQTYSIASSSPSPFRSGTTTPTVVLLELKICVAHATSPVISFRAALSETLRSTDWLRAALCGHAGTAGATLANLPRDGRRRLLAALKDLRVPVAKSRGYDHAEVTRGGVVLAEVDPRTMQSRRQSGLFVCGELLDVDGPIGGFNFQAAFATGRLAGQHA